MITDINKIELTVKEKGNVQNMEIINTYRENGVAVFRLKFTYEGSVHPEMVSLNFKVPCIDIFSVWSPLHVDERNIMPVWKGNKADSRAGEGAPVQTAISRTGKNRMTVALSDPKTPVQFRMGVNESDVIITCSIDIFTLPVGKLRSYDADLRIDLRDIPYYQAIAEVREWWSEYGYASAYVPDVAKYPMYSTWYSFHQDLNADEIVEQCRIAKTFGCRAVLIDDGWQTDDCSCVYSYCGDWQISKKKVGDMKQLIKRIHDLDMKVILWYSVPFVGRNSEAWKQFENCFLDNPEEKEWCCLDPRFPHVREYLIGLYTRAASEWKLDGFKLDFIDRFNLTEYSLHKSGNGRDFDSLEDGIEALLHDAMTKLREINPDILIEFRQKYMGPLMQTYGNMLRVSDCPADGLKNRIGMVDLRMLSGNTAVHSDMLEWNYEDTPENAAQQMISILYTVPQISVRLEKINEEHKKMLAFYLKFWCEYRDVLLSEHFKAVAPWANYSAVCTEKDGTMIVTAYENQVVEIKESAEKLILVNGLGKSGIILKDAKRWGGKECVIFDCMGNVVQKLCLPKDSLMIELSVPTSGIACITEAPNLLLQ